MRKQTQEDLQKIYQLEDMLKGNINRMCLTDEEFDNLSLEEYKNTSGMQEP